MDQFETIIAGYRFNDVVLDLRNRQLRRSGKVVALNSKYFDVLALLVSRPGQLTTKHFIFDKVWGDVIVTDTALSQCIKDIRKQLGDDAGNPRYIKTVPKHGYVFFGDSVQITENELSKIIPSPQIDLERRPYKFLDYFTEQDAGLFFGRESEIQAICSKIIAHRSFVLHGRSGVGKSSIVRAGLLPCFSNQGHFVFVIRCFTDPLQEMVNTLSKLPETKGVNKGQLDELIRQAVKSGSKRSVIFILDQFEEFFSLLSEKNRQKFIKTIGELFANEFIPLKFLFVLREDLLAEMSCFKMAIPEIYHHEFRLERLSREQAARAISEPAKTVGCPFEVLLIDRILDDLDDHGYIDPPQMQIVCDALYDVRDAVAGLTIEGYEKLGGASQILAGYLERVMRRFNSEDLKIAKEILMTLISADKHRLVMRISELAERVCNGKKDKSKIVNKLIEDLSAARVVRFRRQDGEGWLELAHDFLIPEVSRWLTAEEYALKRARAVIERAMENFSAHQLLIDIDALDLILPFGERLGLTGDEAELIIKSMLNRARHLPDWLARRLPSALNLIIEASRNTNPDVRQAVIQSCFLIDNKQIKMLLLNLALWDEDLLVRKSASIALVEKYGQPAERMLARDSGSNHAGLIRRAISLAFIRDYNKSLINLFHLPFAVALLVVSGLMWVRLIRGKAEIVRQVGGGTFGAAMSGFIIGAMLGTGLAFARHAPTFEASSIILVLSSLGMMAGAFGGFGVSFGMVAVDHITYRHSHWWSIVGGAMGGAAIGGILNVLGLDILRALFGHNLSEIAGAFEGVVMGAGITSGAVLAERLPPRARPWQKIAGAAIGSMFAAVLLTSIQGNLFSGSIETIARSFADSQIRLDPLASFFGEVNFGRISRIVLGAVEGFLFGGFLIAGAEIFKRRNISIYPSSS